jgi:hypothetical protein
MTRKNMIVDVDQIAAEQTALLRTWYTDAPEEVPAYADLLGAVRAQHYCNFRLWSLEDQARRRDVSAERIADVKRGIDGWNQRRNDLMEVLDEKILSSLPQPDHDRAEQHSETAGMMIDRLSILSLKIHHMGINAAREDDAVLADECSLKLRTLRSQHADLTCCLGRLLSQCEAGERYFKLYRQHKAYNDPRLNPALSGRGRDPA